MFRTSSAGAYSEPPRAHRRKSMSGSGDFKETQRHSNTKSVCIRIHLLRIFGMKKFRFNLTRISLFAAAQRSRQI